MIPLERVHWTPSIISAFSIGSRRPKSCSSFESTSSWDRREAEMEAKFKRRLYEKEANIRGPKAEFGALDI